ncbi:hypothetical protein WJX73_009214 [Symbiochloris irregularis]|uniref:Uncharacterized protein n=1 Tax=Symbiochloris irregularis TaxID=706552 RepID=A0AAW1P961_9CHLO
MDNWDGGRGYGGRGGGRGGRNNFGRSYNNNNSRSSFGTYQDSYQPRGGRGNNYQHDSRSNNNFDRGSGHNGSYYQPRPDSYNSRGRGGGRTWGPRNTGGRGRGRGPGPEPEDIEFLGIYGGDKDAITALLLDAATSQIYTGSKEGFLRTWRCSNPTAPKPVWECVSKVDMDGVVDSLLLEGGFMCVGMHNKGGGNPALQPGGIKVCHLESGKQHVLPGHQGQVHALAAAGGMLFSGGQDGSIRAWRLDPGTACFALAKSITAQDGGHAAAVTTLVPTDRFLFSADFHGNIKVWDMQSGQCVQTLDKGHGSVVTDMIFWQNHLISASLDSNVRIWAEAEKPAPGAVLDREPAYTHVAQDAQGKPATGGILKMTGAVDSANNAVLLTSHNGEHAVRLWELPSFADRGQLRASDPRALGAGFAGMLFSGDMQGNLKAWRWKPAAMPVG